MLANAHVNYVFGDWRFLHTPLALVTFQITVFYPLMCLHMDTICLTLCLFFFSGGQVAKLYRDASLGNVVNIIVTRLIVLTEDQVRKTLFLLRHLVCFTVFLIYFTNLEPSLQYFQLLLP